MAWIVAIAESSSQRVALEDHLTEKGFSCYSPRYRFRVRHRGQRLWRIGHLFGRYFFVSLIDNWREIFSSRGVLGVLMSSGAEHPSMVSDATIDELRAREDKGFVEVQKEKFLRGQRVVIGSGPLLGSVGEFLGIGNADREVVLVDILGCKTRVEVAPGVLSLA